MLNPECSNWDLRCWLEAPFHSQRGHFEGHGGRLARGNISTFFFYVFVCSASRALSKALNNVE